MVTWDMLKKYGEIFGRGIISVTAPTMVKGALNEFLRDVKMDTVIEWVQSNKSLWQQLDPQRQEHFRTLKSELGSIDWLDSDWVINAVKKEHPALSSLFRGWVKAKNWLERQTVIIKRELEE